MSIAHLLAGSDAGAKSRMDAATGTNIWRRESAAETARRLTQSAIVLDCETTGVGVHARVWEVEIWDFQNTLSIKKWMFNPGMLSPGAGSQFEWEQGAYDLALAALGGDPIVCLAERSVFAGAATDIVELLANRDVCGWCCEEFDERMLRKELMRVNFAQFSQRWQMVRWHDVMRLYLRWRTEVGRPATREDGAARHRISLAEACRDEGIRPEETHRASSGVRCCMDVLLRIAGVQQ